MSPVVPIFTDALCELLWAEDTVIKKPLHTQAEVATLSRIWLRNTDISNVWQERQRHKPYATPEHSCRRIVTANGKTSRTLTKCFIEFGVQELGRLSDIHIAQGNIS